MKRLFAALAMTAVLFGTAVPALAEDPPAPPTTEQTVTELPEVSVTPDSPFYGLKLFVERLREFITRDAAERAELLSTMGETRLLEATQMMEAGRPDLAAEALEEAQQKFHQAQAVVDAAVDAGKELTDLQAQLTANEVNLKLALARIMSEVSEEDQPEFEAIATDVMIEFAAAKDSAEADKELVEAAEQLADQAQELADEAEELAPRIRAALDALALESGKDLSEVLDLYNATNSVSTVATQLKIKLEFVREAAKIEIKIDGDEIKVEIKAADGTKTEIKIEDGKTEIEVEEREQKPKEKKEKEKGCKEHPVFKVHPGRGKKC